MTPTTGSLKGRMVQAWVRFWTFCAGEAVAKWIFQMVFSIRWSLLPLYAGLWAVMGIYVAKYLESIWGLMLDFNTCTDNQLKIAVLEAIDKILLAHLIVTTPISGFSIFVREIDFKTMKDRPRGLNNLNSSTQKIKTGMSLMGIGIIQLLTTFMQVSTITWTEILKQAFVFGLFILGTVAFCWIDILLHTGHNEHAGFPEAPVSQAPSISPQPQTLAAHGHA